MKNLILTLTSLFLFSFSAAALDTDVSYCTFKAGDKQYIEVSLFLVGNTLTYQEIDSLSGQASVDVLMLIKQGENIVQYEKYTLNGPITQGQTDFLDSKRFVLADGEYTLEVQVVDALFKESKSEYSEAFSIGFSDTELQQSDIQLLASYKKAETQNVFVKNGYQLEPLAFNFYNKRAHRLIFYNEIYNSDKAIGQDYLVTYTVTEVENDVPTKPVSIGHKRKSAAQATVLLLQTDITELPSGNYELAVEVRNRENQLLSRKTKRFQRSNPYLEFNEEDITKEAIQDEFVQNMNAKELEYALRAIAVILNDQDGDHLNMLIRKRDVEAQKLYLFSYWVQQNPVQPYRAYIDYMKIAQAIDDQFDSGFGYGFETDRGYVYMKYGQPSDILREINDPSAPPYEIWSYNDFPATNQNLVKFIFYNPSLSPGNYVMLHSTARGEVNNPNWQQQIYQNVPNSDRGGAFDTPSAGFGNGRNAGRNWSDW